MIYLRSTSYWMTWAGIMALIYIKPMSLGHTSVILSSVCACAMLGRSLIQFNSGAPISGIKSPEFQYLLFVFAYSLLTFKCCGDSKWSGLAIALSVGAYNVARGIANHYRAVNPMILR